MSEAAAQAIEPVNATSTGTTPVPEGHTSPMERGFEEVVNRLNKKYAGGQSEQSGDGKSLSDIVDKVEREAKAPVHQPKQEAKPTPPPALNKPDPRAQAPKPEGQKPEDQSQVREKYMVDGKEYELSADQAKRFAQKGIALEKRVIDIAKGERQVQEWQAQKAQEDAQKQQFFQQLGQNPGEVLESLFGPEVFARLKPWAAQKVQREMDYEQNPQLAAQEQQQYQQQQIVQENEQLKQQLFQQQVAQEAQVWEKKYTDTIMHALQQSGIPKTDFTAKEMAEHMDRAAARNIEYTPEHLAQLVREDNTVRIRSLTDGLVSQITEARKSNDTESIIRCGDQIVEMFGEPLMYAIAKYHLAKLQKGRFEQPKQIVDTPKTQVQPEKKGWGENGKQYMSEDKYREMRQKIARGEMSPPPGW